MAGDWIKLEHGIIDKPEVMELSEILDITPHQVVGHLVEFWFWCDRNLSPECPRVKGTKRGLDRVAGRDGFGDALVQVGWLTFEDGYFSVPNYDNHLSKSAKKRANEQRKKAFQRSKVSPTCPENVPHDQGTKPGPEKRREEKRNSKSKNAGVDHPGFASWYEIYPKKKARGAASKAYSAAIAVLEREHGDDASAFLQARTLALVPDMPSDPQFIPFPATWLNGQRWADEPTQKPAASRVLTREELEAWRPS